ncbi:MAG TPA: DevR family CRISPR-associated autoregulator [Chloroflexia bacterium]|nr:DevR family CRISPR-associated autoregulator [Chloroflexia bacterium]
MAFQIYSLAISGQATLNLHSLNNEGGEGNQIATRMVNVLDSDYELRQVNAISGDMYKHIQAEHLQRIAKQRGLPLCKGCEEFNANRILFDQEFTGSFSKQTPDRDVIDKMLARCTLDDMEGILITANNKALGRKSVVEFGWVAGVPEKVKTESYFHVKYVADSGKLGENTAKDEANLGQNIFHRPASSGSYAVVVTLEAARIGFNDIRQEYGISNEERRSRFAAMMESLLYTFVQPNGAMRNTQNPHIANFEGVVTLTSDVLPAPTISPLNSKYKEELTRIAGSFNNLRGGEVVQLRPFNSMADFAEIMTDLILKAEPYKLNYGRQ